MNKSIFQILLFVFLAQLSNAQLTTWAEPTQESKPWTRWWWPNNALDKANITRELEEFARMGIGGVEITPIYGVIGEEHRDIEFLSDEFTGVLKYTISEANRLGMGVDLPPGSGWRCGGPFVPEEKGLWNLKILKEEVKDGEQWRANPDIGETAAALFVSADGEKEVIDFSSAFTTKGNGTIFTAVRTKSGNKVKRPSKGGEGWAIDTFNKEITEWYLDEFWKRLKIGEGELRCFFHDSFEYTGDFTLNFLDEFRTRRGYNLEEYLYALDPDCTDKELHLRVKSDYRQTLADLVLDSFIAPMTVWANDHKSLNRNQAHGSPGNILDLYAACDIPETEIFQTLNQKEPDVFVNKFASSAANITGKKLVSSESYTWLQEHWTVTPSDLVQATNRFFLAGVDHMFFHGTCYSPEDDEWPGWLFYASTQLNNRNPIWREMPTLFKYIERSQNILQSSKAKNDLLIYWPYFDVAASEGKIFNHIGVNKDAGWFNEHPIFSCSRKLMNAGYTFDFISDKQLLDCAVKGGMIETSGKAYYKAIVVPETKYIPLETMQQLADFIAAGGKVYFEKFLPLSVPGLYELEERSRNLDRVKSGISKARFAGDVLQNLKNNDVLGEEDLARKGFHLLKMQKDGEDWYMVFNTGEKKIDEWVEINSKAKEYILLDPMSGEIGSAQSGANKIRIQLEKEQALFVRCSRSDLDDPEFPYEEKDAKSIDIGALWHVEFTEGGPVYPGNLQMDNLVSWTVRGDHEAERYAGTVRYKTEFVWEADTKKAVLNLGRVKDCARITLNGKTIGTTLGPVFKINVNNLVKGKNTLLVDVTNVAANRIRDLDRRGVVWRKFYDINLVNLNYEEFDSSDWQVREAGLLGPVSLTPIKTI